MKLEKTKYFWTYVIFGALCTLLGVALLPQWASADVFFSKWGIYSVNITISGLIFGYIGFYLVKRIRRYSNTPAQVVSMVELVVMAIIAIVCTLSLFADQISFGGPCEVFAIVLWARGVSGVFTGYYCDSNVVKEAETKKKAIKNGEPVKEEKVMIDGDEKPQGGRVDDFTVWRLAFAVALISVGTYLYIKPVIEAIHLQWVFSCATIGVGLFFVVFGLAKKPVKVKIDASSPKKGNTDRVKNGEGTQKTSVDEKEEKKQTIEDGAQDQRVNIKLSDSANAVTQTAVYDAVKDETSLAVKED